MAKQRVVVGMSGGVDSSVTAALLKEQGYDVVGAFAIGWTGTKDFPCNWQSEEADARQVAEQLGIPFYTVNLSAVYEELVITRFLEAYKIGETPNPDVLCNSEVKFQALWTALRQLEPDYFATGHYARLAAGGDGGALYRGIDQDKDQSYFLWRIDRSVLDRTLFPIGALRKSEVRALARKYDLPTASKKDSQGVCFVGPLKVRAFLAHHLAPSPGSAYLADGRLIARHDGAALYTIGQRLGAGSVDWTGDVPPLFVLAKDLSRNRLVVGSDADLFSTQFSVNDTNWFTEVPRSCWVQVRYRSEAVEASLEKENDEYRVTLAEPVRAITPGQSAVFYDQQGRVLGGGVIRAVPAISALLHAARLSA